MELQQIDGGSEVWNSTYEFGKGIGIKQERQRIEDIIKRYKNKPSFTFENLLSLIEGE